MKLIRFGAVFLVILMVATPIFETSSQPALMNIQLSTRPTIELMDNHAVQTESVFQCHKDKQTPKTNEHKIEIPGNPLRLSYATDNVTFNESGLPHGDVWYVNLSGNYSSGPIVTHNYTFHLSNKTYSYVIGTTVKIYHANGGIISLPTSNSTEQINFYPYVYDVNFTGKGLYGYNVWSVDFNGRICSSFTSMTFHVTNGTYHYTICNLTNYNITQPKGIIVVNGQPVQHCVILVGFAILKGIITPTDAAFTFNGTVEKLNASGTFCMRLKPGIYSFTVSALGYDTDTQNRLNLTAGTTIMRINLQLYSFLERSHLIFIATVFGSVFLVAGIAYFLRKKVNG